MPQVIALTTRFADLDTQRHVTSRTYESMAMEGRYLYLADRGYDWNSMLVSGVRLRALRGHVRFLRQQYPGTTLQVETDAFRRPQQQILWNQVIREKEGAEVAHLQLLTELEGKEGPLPLETMATDAEPTIHLLDLPSFSGACEQVVSSYTMPYSERDAFGEYPVAAIWRIFEEGRWLFSTVAGLTYEKIVEMDTTSFYMGGDYVLARMPRAGQTLKIHTWISKVDKIRFYFMQEVYDGSTLVAAMRDEQLIVSLSRARPQRAPEAFVRFLGAYIEKQ
ncbi:MAG: acyl-[acyl-carrier-protein] thioesterase [Spirochaetales bacterium]|nr:acyl-[acyl-carrier-protein] thioesterase [Spirochaetales bacterium]